MSNGSWCPNRYYKILHLGVFWPVSLEDLLFPTKAKESEKDIHYLRVHHRKIGLIHQFDKWHLFRVACAHHLTS